MENLQKLIAKKVKLKPWHIVAFVLLLMGLVCVFMTTFLVRTTGKVVAMLCIVIPILISSIYYCIYDHIDTKIMKELKNILSKRLKDNKMLENIHISIERMNFKMYCITVDGNTIDGSDIPTIVLSNITDDIVDSMYNEISLSVVIRPAIVKTNMVS